MSYVISTRTRHPPNSAQHTNMCTVHTPSPPFFELLFYIRPLERNNHINNGHLRRTCLSFNSGIFIVALFRLSKQTSLSLILAYRLYPFLQWPLLSLYTANDGSLSKTTHSNSIQSEHIRERRGFFRGFFSLLIVVHMCTTPRVVT